MPFTSGGQQLAGTKRHPTIEDHVTIVGALGGQTVIGTHSTIGGNVFIMDSVKPHSLVIYDGLDMRVLDKQEKKKPATITSGRRPKSLNLHQFPNRTAGIAEVLRTAGGVFHGHSVGVGLMLIHCRDDV